MSTKFTKEDATSLKELVDIADNYLGENDKRIANALHKTLEILRPYLLQSGANIDEVLKEFIKLTGEDIDDLIEDLMLACLNTAQYGRGLEICDLLKETNLRTGRSLNINKAQFYAHLENTDKAKEIILKELKNNERDTELYVYLGDVYYLWQVIDSKRNFDQAQRWYYKGYDLGLADNKTEEGALLLERLGEVCIDNLRILAEKELLNIFDELKIGGWETLAQFQQDVYLNSYDSIIFHHLQNLLTEVDSIEETNKNLEILNKVYGFIPQKSLEGWCSFEKTVLIPQGENDQRIREEMMDAFKNEMKFFPEEKMGAQFSEYFSKFQEKFLMGTDKITGKVRWNLVEKERKKIDKEFNRGKFLWMGFVEFRNYLFSQNKLIYENFNKFDGKLPGRNDPCWCNSNKKFKKCHGS